MTIVHIASDTLGNTLLSLLSDPIAHTTKPDRNRNIESPSIQIQPLAIHQNNPALCLGRQTHTDRFSDRSGTTPAPTSRPSNHDNLSSNNVCSGDRDGHRWRSMEQQLCVEKLQGTGMGKVRTTPKMAGTRRFAGQRLTIHSIFFQSICQPPNRCSRGRNPSSEAQNCSKERDARS